MTLEELIDMLETNKKIHEDYVAAQWEKLSTLNSTCKCIRTLSNYLNCITPDGLYTEKSQLLNLYTEIDTQREQTSADISKHKVEINNIEVEIVKLRVNYLERGE